MTECMEKATKLLSSSIVGIRSGTVTAGVIDTLRVSAYGQLTPIKHLGNAFKSGNHVHIDPYDPTLVGTIAKGLTAAGFNAYAFSKTRVMVSIPPPCGEETQRIITHLNKLCEETKISIRNIRKKYRNAFDKEQLKTLDAEIQEITDLYIAETESIIQNKIEAL